MHLQMHTYLTPTYKSRVILIKFIVIIYSKFAIMFLCNTFTGGSIPTSTFMTCSTT